MTVRVLHCTDRWVVEQRVAPSAFASRAAVWWPTYVVPRGELPSPEVNTVQSIATVVAQMKPGRPHVAAPATAAYHRKLNAGDKPGGGSGSSGYHQLCGWERGSGDAHTADHE